MTNPEHDGGSAITEQERRGRERRGTQGAVFCRVVADDGPLLRGELIDLSNAGVGLVLNSWLPRNQEIEVAFTSLAKLGLLVRGFVRHARVMDEASWRIGCEFQRPLSDEELSSVLEEVVGDPCIPFV
jgi:hypothetical protein